MPTKKGTDKKSNFSLAPITLSEPVKITDGFTNLVDAPPKNAETAKAERRQDKIVAQEHSSEDVIPTSRSARSTIVETTDSTNKLFQSETENEIAQDEAAEKELNLTEAELLRLLDAESFDEIYELTDVLRASSLKLYAALVRLSDARGRARAKNHELMSKAGIKGIATLYKQERWLMDLKLLEKKAKPGPHDGSSYVVHGLERLPLPAEIYEKFRDYLAKLN